MNLCEEAPPERPVKIRDTLNLTDRQQIALILSATAMFYPHEIQIALELLDEGLAQGDKSSYRFSIAEDESGVLGYSCFGKIPCTLSSFDLYWIAVRSELKRRGIGKLLLRDTERRALALGAERMYIDTASRSAYRPTQAFYLSCGYELEARLRDFYAPGDDKLIFSKTFIRSLEAAP